MVEGNRLFTKTHLVQVKNVWEPFDGVWCFGDKNDGGEV